MKHENAKPHMASVVKIYLKIDDWEDLSHPLYSAYIAPSDYYLFPSMQSALQNVPHTSFENIENWLDETIERQRLL